MHRSLTQCVLTRSLFPECLCVMMCRILSSTRRTVLFGIPILSKIGISHRTHLGTQTSSEQQCLPIHAFWNFAIKNPIVSRSLVGVGSNRWTRRLSSSLSQCSMVPSADIAKQKQSSNSWQKCPLLTLKFLPWMVSHPCILKKVSLIRVVKLTCAWMRVGLCKVQDMHTISTYFCARIMDAQYLKYSFSPNCWIEEYILHTRPLNHI